MNAGALYMIGSAAAFALMTASVKWVGERIPSQEIVLVRAVISLVLSWLLLRRAGIPALGTRRGLLLLRGLFGFAGLSCVFAALTRLPLAEATVLQYMHPTFTALLAFVVLRERAGKALWVGSLVSFLGVVVVAQPDGALPPLPIALGLGGAFFSAAAYVTVRRLSHSEHPLVIVMYFPLVTLPASIPFVWHSAVWPRGVEWAGLLCVGLFAQLGQVWLTRGLSLLPAARGTALSYVQVVFAAALGWAIFGESVTATTLVGALLVMAGTLGVSLTGRSRT